MSRHFTYYDEDGTVTPAQFEELLSRPMITGRPADDDCEVCHAALMPGSVGLCDEHERQARLITARGY